MARKDMGSQTQLDVASSYALLGEKPDTRPLHIAVIDGDDRTAVALAESARKFGRCWTWQSHVNGSRPVATQSPQPDAVLMDVQSSGLHELVSLREIKAVLPAVPLIVRAKFLGWNDVQELVAAGASGFMLRPTMPEALVQTIEVVLQNGVGLCPEVQATLFAHLRCRAVDNRCPKLTWQERKIFHLLAERLSNQEIAAKLGVSTVTIHAHLAHIYKKLGVHSREEARRKLTGTD